MSFDSRRHPRGENPDNRGEFSTVNHGEPESMLSSDWPAHARRTEPWHQQNRSGTREDRMLSEINVWLPPMIAEQDMSFGSQLASDMEEAIREITVLENTHTESLAALSQMLLRTESVSSSKIEHVEASVADYARALHGIKTNPSAVSMAAATTALESMIDGVGRSREVTLELLTTAHAALMRDDRTERDYAGRLRDMQNWIGGSDHSPRGALYIPPPPNTVDAYMADLIGFSNRNDLPVIAQAALAHAQFESIHPFTDGNGRIGRALVNTILRRRGATTSVVIPIASAIVARREHYFDLLGRYREGDAAPIVAAFTSASRIAAKESQVTATRLATIPETWAEQVGRVRRGSVTHQLLAKITTNPVITAEDASRLVPGPESSVYTAIDRLAGAGVFTPLTDRTRNQVWGAKAILDELDDLNLRIGIAARG